MAVLATNVSKERSYGIHNPVEFIKHYLGHISYLIVDILVASHCGALLAPL